MIMYHYFKVSISSTRSLPFLYIFKQRISQYKNLDKRVYDFEHCKTEFEN